MIDINEYINTVYEAKQESTSNKERLEQLEKWLNDKKYPDYVKTLNRMLKDPKARVLLQDGFGADLGDIKFNFQPRLIRAGSLVPTQAEIDFEKSLKHALTKKENIRNDFSNKIIVNKTPNIYDNEWTVEKIKKYIDETITDDVVKELYKHLEKCNDKDDVVKVLTDNVVRLKVDNPPVSHAPHRGDMPQPDKAGNKPGDKTTSQPDDEGSALNKLRDGNYQFVKGNVYSGTRINDNWYCIDSVGVNAETFNVNFKYEVKDK